MRAWDDVGVVLVTTKRELEQRVIRAATRACKPNGWIVFFNAAGEVIVANMRAVVALEKAIAALAAHKRKRK